jgi:hypothetical protein
MLQGAWDMPKKFILACLIALTIGAAVGFAMPTDSANAGTLQYSP